MKNSFLSPNRALFLLLLIAEIGGSLFLTLQHRMPLGHDGFQSFAMQYFFLNDKAVNNEVPLWIPYMNHGITATWWYGVQGAMGILGKALLLTGKLIVPVNFTDVFHYGIFVDRLVLLTGVWLLGEYYFESAWTRFFVAGCVMGSTVTMTQFKFTFHLYYALPLMLYLGHAFLNTGRWRYLFLTCNLFAVQMLSNEVDVLPIISLTVFLYFLFYALDQPSLFGSQIKNLRWGPRSTACVAAGLLSFALLAAIFAVAKDPGMINLNGGRNLDSSVPLNVFLTYGGNMDFRKWQELLLRFSPSMDFTVYIGFMALPCVFFGLFFSSNRLKHPLVLLICVLLFFSMGTWVSVFFYYLWPMMKFYRHLGLISPLIKLLVLFLAGFGFEKILVYRQNWQGQRMVSYACLGAGLLLVIVSFVLDQMAAHGAETRRYLVSFLSVQTIQMPFIFDPTAVAHKLKEASFYGRLAGLFFCALPLINVKKHGSALVIVALLINAADLGGYYLSEIKERTFALNKDQYTITAFSPTPYVYRRTLQANQRQRILDSPLGQHTLYAATNAFLFQDALATRYRTIERLEPLNEMLAAFGPGVLANPAFLKIAGSSADKIQFFNRACDGHNEKQLARWLGAPAHPGDILAVSRTSGKTLESCSQGSLTADDHLSLAYKIKNFTPNTLQLSVDVPSAGPVWMMYADTWHPAWKAWVNGRPVTVFKADLAYKALVLPPGKNLVQFAFISRRILLLEVIADINALAWLIILLFLMAGILFPQLAPMSHPAMNTRRPPTIT